MHQQLALSLSSIALIIEMFFMVYAGGGAGVGVGEGHINCTLALFSRLVIHSSQSC